MAATEPACAQVCVSDRPDTRQQHASNPPQWFTTKRTDDARESIPRGTGVSRHVTQNPTGCRTAQQHETKHRPPPLCRTTCADEIYTVFRGASTHTVSWKLHKASRNQLQFRRRQGDTILCWRAPKRSNGTCEVR